MINGHGDDIYSYKREIVSNFSSNIYARQDASGLHEYLCSRINAIHSYPEPDAGSISKLLADKHFVLSDNICVTNGATEAIYLIAQAFRAKNSAVVYPTFSEYGDACSVHEHHIRWVKNLDEVSPQTDLVWLCNPNNPTGTVTDKCFLTRYIVSHPEQYIVIDQSYEHFTIKPLFDIAEAVQYKNLILLHSMTKHYAIPGLRLGYVTAHADTLAMISRYCMPWSVNGLAVEAGKYLLENMPEAIDVDGYLAETKRFKAALSQIEKIETYYTDTHFFLCKLAGGKARDLKQYLIDDFGILIRDASNFYGLDEHYLRVATQSPSENDLLVKAIREWI
ncbi:pyridoxal phosphate-dependent class II aminotransferase [Dysgonomonas sp. 521]|uniref:threonine-phosphate decarboxylase n=1 Tax=Dysgonomonas sp. 521 TaxID=2302932 RepID=UPI0013D81273|nr:threonine-phosphate decarboxylase [Dysgonomonas sp. 521]NDV95827.1 pyridoxal phosphate-dependent class II aminotransferase [Dysgonomonas sp. 521]